MLHPSIILEMETPREHSTNTHTHTHTPWKSMNKHDNATFYGCQHPSNYSTWIISKDHSMTTIDCRKVLAISFPQGRRMAGRRMEGKRHQRWFKRPLHCPSFSSQKWMDKESWKWRQRNSLTVQKMSNFLLHYTLNPQLDYTFRERETQREHNLEISIQNSFLSDIKQVTRKRGWVDARLNSEESKTSFIFLPLLSHLCSSVFATVKGIPNSLGTNTSIHTCPTTYFRVATSSTYRKSSSVRHIKLNKNRFFKR